MSEQQNTDPEDGDLVVEIGDLTALTEGQGGGSSEDKRRAYNS
ncbi:albusnodin family lasso peptide [Kitasatospora sp. NPDC056184]